MANMRCEQFQDVLAEQIDGPLPQDAAAHLDACPQCRWLRDDLQAIAVAAREWGTVETDPPARVWISIEARLRAEGLIADPGLAATEPKGWRAGWWNLAARLELAGAYVLLLLVAAGLAGYRSLPVTTAQLTSQPSDSASAVQMHEPALDRLGATLDGNMQLAVASLSPNYGDSLALSLQRNLQIVDNLIVVCEKKVRENPEDQLAREYLYGAYQQKADLLAVAMDRSASEAK
jgi:hypothetical protein